MAGLDGKHVFIAGGSRGIGAATALLAADRGASVTVNYRSSDRAAEGVVDRIADAGGRAVAMKADLSQDGEAKRAVAAAEGEFGPVAGLVVAAGIFEPAPIDEMTVEFWDRTMAVNVRATFLALQACLPGLRANGGGSVVILTSTAGQRGSEVYSAYATSKGAQIMFMRSMARELAGDRIRVNCIAPAWTDTDMARPAMESIGMDEIVAGFPLGRIGRPEDVAEPVCFLLGDGAGFITGTTVTVDGGMDMRG